MAVYLDCAATTPIDPRVREVVLRFLDEDFGNAGSRTHDYGQRARRAVEQARQQVAAVVDASRGDVIFTSGATEATTWPSSASPWRPAGPRTAGVTW